MPVKQIMLKRILDFCVALIALVFLSPLLFFVTLLVWLNLGNPILFRQERPGLHGQPFFLYKFRSMKSATDRDGSPLPDENRLTRFGAWLRSTSLDELPALYNVLKGELSLVGPRPLLCEYLPLYSREQVRRHDVVPGITGWAQINGRNAISWEEKFKLDIWYVDNQSFSLDLKILWRTLHKVAVRQGISADNSATMTKFTGSE